MFLGVWLMTLMFLSSNAIVWSPHTRHHILMHEIETHLIHFVQRNEEVDLPYESSRCLLVTIPYVQENREILTFLNHTLPWKEEYRDHKIIVDATGEHLDVTFLTKMSWEALFRYVGCENDEL